MEPNYVNIHYQNIKKGKFGYYYCSETYDTTIIELFPDKDNINNFLEIDEKIYQEN